MQNRAAENHLSLLVPTSKCRTPSSVAYESLKDLSTKLAANQDNTTANCVDH